MRNLLLITIMSALTGLPAFAQSQPESPFPFLTRFNNVRDFCISQQGDEVYFSVQSPNQNLSHIVCVRKTGTSWGEPELVSFSGMFNDLEPFLDPNQKRLWFASNRPVSDTATEPGDFNIWYVERTAPGAPWSQPVNPGAPLNSAADEFYPSVSENGEMIFTCECPGGPGKDDIYHSKMTGTTFSKPTLLDTSVNSPGYEFNAFISRNGDLLFFTRYNAPGGMGSGDLYVARKNSAGVFETPVNLGPSINSRFMEYCPFYDERNKTLYFTSKRDNLKPGTFRNLEDYLAEITRYENGFSRIYKVPFDPVRFFEMPRK